MPSDRATSATGRASTLVCQNACQVGSRHRAMHPRRRPAKHLAAIFEVEQQPSLRSSGSHCSLSSCMTSLLPLPSRWCLGRVRKLMIALRAMRNSQSRNRPALGVGLPAIDRPRHGDEHFLGELLGVGVLQAAATGQAIHQRQINLRRTPPRPRRPRGRRAGRSG